MRGESTPCSRSAQLKGTSALVAVEPSALYSLIPVLGRRPLVIARKRDEHGILRITMRSATSPVTGSCSTCTPSAIFECFGIEQQFNPRRLMIVDHDDVPPVAQARGSSLDRLGQCEERRRSPGQRKAAGYSGFYFTSVWDKIVSFSIWPDSVRESLMLFHACSQS